MHDLAYDFCMVLASLVFYLAASDEPISERAFESFFFLNLCLSTCVLSLGISWFMVVHSVRVPGFESGFLHTANLIRPMNRWRPSIGLRF